ncbi:hypothetical protein BD309DRAFT_948225 [Dichomitus squalens]|nr:hypothetical protein BD309DRAFT_948225 [Dichomitus squalens]
MSSLIMRLSGECGRSRKALRRVITRQFPSGQKPVKSVSAAMASTQILFYCGTYLASRSPATILCQTLSLAVHRQRANIPI